MTAVLSQLRGMGYRIEAEEGEVVYRWTGPGDPPEEARTLLSELSRRKGEALALLHTEADRPPMDPAGPCPDYPFCVHSRTLDTQVWIVPDSWREPLPGPAYTWAEVRALNQNRPTPEALRAVHQVKLVVDGEVVA